MADASKARKSAAPAIVKRALEIAASRLGDALNQLNYPNGGKDAVFAEANLVAYATHGLLSQETAFSCYAEASHSKGRRIDLLAFDGIHGLAIEAKKFGDVEGGSNAILADIARLREFRPTTSPPANEESRADDWCAKAPERWGVVLVGSHGGDAVRDAWLAPNVEAATLALNFKPGVAGRAPSKTQRGHARSIDVLTLLRSHLDATVDAATICSGKRWLKCADAHLLWAMFPLATLSR